ncbi:MAG TPA: selenium-dependent molybdenum cofactor biosynthesis protein YqeB [Candidatus Ozemobacteraceae bacterium]|nr:selenium-dependent molybdenum cofactor biosynthesis protein YqeB [Candidatus Ozemobacteraceae bacterium]
MKVLILGAGELASGTAHRLFRAGFEVAMTEVSEPLAIRRAVSFCSAVWDGEIVVEGVRGRRLESDTPLPAHLDHVVVIVDPEARLIAAWHPDVLIDARMLKRPGGTSVAQAPLVLSLGPGAVCGRDAHLVVETNRGHDLGRLIETGSASADTGVPGAIGGVAAGRVLRAPAAGQVRGIRAIGDLVQAGDLVAWVGEEPVYTRISGVLRGILHDGVTITLNTKLADVDPRGEVRACFTVSDKSRTISGAVLEAILNRFSLVGR